MAVLGYFIPGKKTRFPDAVWCKECGDTDPSPGDRKKIEKDGDLKNYVSINCDGCGTRVRGYAEE